MIKFAFIKNGKVDSVVVPSDDNSYTSGNMYGDQLAIAVDHSIPNGDILKMRYHNNELFAIVDPPNENDYIYDYATASWNVISPVTNPSEFAIIQDTTIKKSNGDLYTFITKESGFVEWKQAEYADNYSELSIKKLTNGVSAEEQTMIDNIVLVRAWKNQLKSDNDVVTNQILNATSIDSINTAVASMVYSAPPFDL